MTEKLDRKPYHDQEEGYGEEDGQGCNIILLRPGRNTTLAQAQSFGDEALLDCAGRCYACGDRRLVAFVCTETCSIGWRTGGCGATAQHGHRAVHLRKWQHPVS